MAPFIFAKGSGGTFDYVFILGVVSTPLFRARAPREEAAAQLRLRAANVPASIVCAFSCSPPPPPPHPIPCFPAPQIFSIWDGIGCVRPCSRFAPV